VSNNYFVQVEDIIEATEIDSRHHTGRQTLYSTADRIQVGSHIPVGSLYIYMYRYSIDKVKI
jgi:hypothetical protein